MAPTIRLLPLETLRKTGPVDFGTWNYRPLLGAIIRKRYELAVALLPKQRVTRILEVGYGSGVFMPELATRCEELMGIDVHPYCREVEAILDGHGVRAHLVSGSITHTSFADSSFDVIVIVSALEFVEDLRVACAEVRRILRPDGACIVVTPNVSTFVDTGLNLLTGRRAKKDFGDRREHIQSTLREFFTVRAERFAPSYAPRFARFYTALELGKKH